MTKQRINEARWIESRQRWQINVQKDGERRTFTSGIKGTKGKVEAERKADKWLESGKQSANVRFSKLYEEFLESIKPPITGTENYRKHEQIGRIWLSPALKHKRVESITPQDWQNCINAACRAGLSQKSLKNIRASITVFCGYARRRKLNIEKPEGLMIPNNAPVGTRKIIQPNALKTLFTVDYITQYGRWFPCYFIHAWRFMVLTGLRRGEAAGLRKEDINGRVLSVRRSINEAGEITRGKNKNAQRDMVLTRHAQEVLSEQAAMLKSAGIISPWLFPDEHGDMLDPKHLYRKWRTYCKQHGISASLYELRHTMISLAKADVPEQLLKRIVGHGKTMDTFGIYGHEVDGELERVAEILDNVYDRLLE